MATLKKRGNSDFFPKLEIRRKHQKNTGILKPQKEIFIKKEVKNF